MAANSGNIFPHDGNSLPAFEAELALGMEHQRAGRFDEAVGIYQRLIAADPGNVDMIVVIGTLCCDLGQFETACRFFEQAISIAPQAAEPRRLLSMALNGLADQRATAGDLPAARHLFQRALELKPKDAASLRGLGQLALLRGDPAGAEAPLIASLAAQSDHPDTFNWLGLAFLQQQKFAQATLALVGALKLRPDLSQARNNLGLALYEQGKLREAQVCFEEVLAQEPGNAHARLNLGSALRILGEHARARREFEILLEAQPESVAALNNLATVYQDTGQPDVALEYLTRALELSPGLPQSHWNIAITQLLLGNYAEGWSNFEYRWSGCDTMRGAWRLPPEREWRGEDISGKHVLVWFEQGFGDTLQFIRFAQDLAARGAKVTAVVQAPLKRLVASAPGVMNAIAPHEPLPPYDFHCPLMSLPYRLGVSANLQSLHGGTPYLSAASEAVSAWRQRMAAPPGLKVGLVWAGNSRLHNAQHAAVDARRSIPLVQFAPILATRGCSFFSLQKGAVTAELQQFGSGLIDYSAEWRDFADTAAFLANLDLVISVDTAVAHLAGAMGKRVWLLNRYDTCWRWMLDCDDSPWYSTLRQFRQSGHGGWQPVIARVAEALAGLVSCCKNI